MNVAAILAIVNAAANLSSSLVPLALELKGQLSSDDEAKLREDLARLRASNDQLGDSVQSLLRGAG